MNAEDQSLARAVMRRLLPHVADWDDTRLDADPMCQWVECLFRKVRDEQHRQPGKDIDVKARQKETIDIALGMMEQLVPNMVDEMTRLKVNAVLDFTWTGGSVTGRMSTMAILDGPPSDHIPTSAGPCVGAEGLEK